MISVNNQITEDYDRYFWIAKGNDESHYLNMKILRLLHPCHCITIERYLGEKEGLMNRIMQAILYISIPNLHNRRKMEQNIGTNVYTVAIEVVTFLFCVS